MSERVEQTSELSADRASRNLVAWSMLAGLLLLAALAGPFFAGRIYTADDLGAFHLPIRAFYAEQLANGEPCDWMPQLFSGFYLTGEGQAGVYHPLHQVLYRLLPLRAALAWEYILPYPLMMLGMWLLLKRRLGRSDAAMLGGLLFAFCSFNLLHFIHPNAVEIIAHIPWLLWAIDVALNDSRRRHVAMACALIALLTGSQLLLGYPQFVWFSLVAEFSYVIFLETAYRYSARSGCDLGSTCDDCVGCTTDTWPRVAIAKGIGLLIGGIQLLPSLDALQHSARQSVSADFTFWGSLHPLNLLQLVAPYMFTNRVWGDSPHEFGVYVGAVPLILVVWLVARQAELGPLSRLAWATIGFAMLMLLLAFGQYGFLYRITTWLPLLGSFRFPCRYLVLFQLAVTVVATIGFLLVIRQNEQVRQQRSQEAQYQHRNFWLAVWRDFEPLWCLVGFAAAVAVAGIKLRHESYIAPIPEILVGPLLLLSAAVLVALAVRGYSSALVGLILLTALDVGYYGLSYSVYSHNACLDKVVASAQTPPGEPDGRVVASLFRVDEPGLRTGDLMTLAGWSRADGYAGLEPRRQLDYRLLPALRVAGVRWVKYNSSTAEIAGLKPYCGDCPNFRGHRGEAVVDEHETAPFGDQHADNKLWLEVPDPLPRIRLLTQTQTTTDPAADIATVCPDTTALCEMPIGLPVSKPGTATLVAEHPGQLEIDVDTPAPQLLVVAESYHSGWQAEIDAQPQKLYRINGDFMGCIVGPGKCRVILTFKPDSLQRGWMTSCIGLSMLSICFLGAVGRSKSRISEDEVS